MRSFVIAGVLAIGAFCFARPAASQGFFQHGVVQCGPSSGWSFRVPGGAWAPQDTGWNAEKIEKGSINLSIRGDIALLLYGDERGVRPVEGEGGSFTVFSRDVAARSLLVVGGYPTGVLEHYLIKLLDGDRAIVTWGTVRPGGPLPSSKVMQAWRRWWLVTP